MPAIDRTAMDSLICDKSAIVDGTMSKCVRSTPAKWETLAVLGSYFTLFGRTSGSDVGFTLALSLPQNKDTFWNLSMFAREQLNVQEEALYCAWTNLWVRAKTGMKIGKRVIA